MWRAASVLIGVVLLCSAPFPVARAQESEADRPVLLDFGQAVAPPVQSPPDTPDTPPEAQETEAVPPPPQAAPAPVPPPPQAVEQTPTPSNVPLAQPLDTRSGDVQSGSFARLSVYFELLGPGLLYSLNVDLVVADVIALRAGYSSFQFFGSVTLYPIFASYLGYGSPDQRYELGLGGVITQNGFDDEVLAAALIGYRYQPVHGGFLFRVGATLLFAFDERFVLPWPYLSFGATF